MSVDPVTQGVRRGAAVFGFLKAWRMDRRERRKAKKTGQAVPVETEGRSMNQQVVTQIALGLVRHAMTATGFGVYLSDDIVVQVVSAVVALAGAIWMARRKVKAVTPGPAA